MKTTKQQLNIDLSPRYAYNDYGIPEAVFYHYRCFEFRYLVPKNDKDLETIQVFDLRKYPAGAGTNGAKPSDVITYQQDTVPEAIGCLEYSQMIVEAYIRGDNSNE